MDFEAFISSRISKLPFKRHLPIVNDNFEDFCSNDYLGLARRFPFMDTDFIPSGSSGSRLISGNHPAAISFENYLSEFFTGFDVLTFTSGYMANLAAISSLVPRNALIFYDEKVHSSIKDAMRLSLGKKIPYSHQQLSTLEKKLKKFNTGIKFIVTESLFSMDGDFTDLEYLTFLSEKHRAYVILDEAHAFGIFGHCHRGMAEYFGLEEKIHVRIITFGKALGLVGAAIIGPKPLREFLVNHARTFIYTTALPPFIYHLLEKNLHYILENSDIHKRFQQNLELFYSIVPSHQPVKSPIFMFRPGKSNLQETAKKMQTHAWAVKAIFPPTVKPGEEAIRITLHSFNRPENVRNLAYFVKKQLHG